MGKGFERIGFLYGFVFKMIHKAERRRQGGRALHYVEEPTTKEVSTVSV